MGIKLTSIDLIASLAELQKAPEVHGCKPWVTNLLILPHELSILSTNIIYYIILFEYVNESQINTCVILCCVGIECWKGDVSYVAEVF